MCGASKAPRAPWMSRTRRLSESSRRSSARGSGWRQRNNGCAMGGWGLDDDQEMVLEHCQAGDTITLTASLLGGMPKKGGKKGGKEKKAKEPVSAPTLLECCLNEETARTRTHSSPSGFAPLAHGEREREWVPGNREASSSDGTSKSSARVAASCSTHASASAPAPAAAAKCTYTLAHWTTCVHVRSWLTNASACSCAG